MNSKCGYAVAATMAGMLYAGGAVASLLTPPSLEDADRRAEQKRISAEIARFREDPERYLAASEASVCELAEPVQWVIAFGEPQATVTERDERRDARSGIVSESRIDSARLLEGECSDGRPDGAFVAVASVVSTSRVESSGDTFEGRTDMRITATMRNGQLDGAFERMSYMEMDTPYSETSEISFTGEIGRYAGGQRTGKGLIVHSASSSLITTVREYRNSRDHKDLVYMGDQRHTESYFRDGERHGFMVLLSGEIGGKHLICYRNGEEAEAGECAGTRW